MRNLVWTPLGKLRLPYKRISETVIAMGRNAYFAVVPYSRNFASDDEHLSMLIWATTDEAAICSLANDNCMIPNSDIVPPGWATHNGMYRYVDVRVLPDFIETATYSGTSGKFKWKNITNPMYTYMYADEKVDDEQLPTVIFIS